MSDGRVRVERRAPRLDPHERIADHLTRSGRFAHVDPTRGRPLPAVARWAGIVGWAAFCSEVARRTVRDRRRADRGS